MITGHYFVGRVEAVAKPDFLECPVRLRNETRHVLCLNQDLQDFRILWIRDLYANIPWQR